MDFQLENFHRDIPDKELLADLRRANEVLQADGRRLSFRTYADAGKYSAGTIAARFGSWNKALAAAGLDATQEKNISRDALFENLRVVWIAKGSQPTFRDMAEQPSKYRGQLYAQRFGNWRTALREFVAFVKSDEWVTVDVSTPPISTKNRTVSDSQSRRTKRSVSERMRFRILLRDGFSCQACGASPLKDRGVELHVDHLLPWSKGGETEDSNLETRCSRCNLGKGDAFEE